MNRQTHVPRGCNVNVNCYSGRIAHKHGSLYPYSTVMYLPHFYWTFGNLKLQPWVGFPDCTHTPCSIAAHCETDKQPLINTFRSGDVLQQVTQLSRITHVHAVTALLSYAFISRNFTADRDTAMSSSKAAAPPSKNSGLLLWPPNEVYDKA